MQTAGNQYQKQIKLLDGQLVLENWISGVRSCVEKDMKLENEGEGQWEKTCTTLRGRS